MTNDFHNLITRMANELDEYRRLLLDDCTVTHRLSNEARAALAKADEPAVPECREPAAVTGQPSDEEGPSAEDVEELCEEHCFNVEGYESIECLQGLINEAIARWGSPTPQPPADGEVAELVEMLKGIAYWRLHGTDKPTPFDIRQAARLTRAADLLQRQVLPEVGE